MGDYLGVAGEKPNITEHSESKSVLLPDSFGPRTTTIWGSGSGPESPVDESSVPHD